MQKIRCTACNARLKLPDSFSGDHVKCPKCGQSFVTASHERDIDSTIPAEHPNSSAQTPVNSLEEFEFEPEPNVEPSEDTLTAAASSTELTERVIDSASDLDVEESKNKAPLFDFHFKRYWTPWIIRVSWFAVLIFASLWIVFLTIGFAGSFLGGSQTSMLDSFGLSDLSMSSLDIEGALSGKADIASLNKFLDDVTKSDGADGIRVAAKPKSAYQSFMSLGFTTLSFLTVIVSTILSVLFCRVFFETIIAVIEILKSLKSIDQKIER